MYNIGSMVTALMYSISKVNSNDYYNNNSNNIH